MNYNQDMSERMIKNSTTGERSSSSSKRKAQMKQKKFMKKVKQMAVVCVIAGVGLTIGGQSLIGHLQDKMTIGAEMNDFQYEVIRDNTHRTNDNEGYWYDYQTINNLISDRIENGADESTELYMLTTRLGEEQANKVLAYKDGGITIDEYTANLGMTQNQWEDLEEKKILASAALEEKNAEIQSMQAQTNTNSNQVNMERGIK